MEIQENRVKSRQEGQGQNSEIRAENKATVVEGEVTRGRWSEAGGGGNSVKGDGDQEEDGDQRASRRKNRDKGEGEP